MAHYLCYNGDKYNAKAEGTLVEFKEKLKQLRKEKALSQQALADLIYVSRSAVAKWESGLGFPSEDSYRALADFFDVDADFLNTDDPEAVIVQKNQKLHRIREIGSLVAFLLLLAFFALIVVSVFLPEYGLVREEVAGVYRDNPYIDAGDYRIYYYSMDFSYNGEAKDAYKRIDGFKIIKRVFIGYRYVDVTEMTRPISWDGNPSGRLVSIQGDGCYYNILRFSGQVFPLDLLSFETAIVNGKVHDVLLNSYFITEKRPTGELIIGDTVLTIGDQ